MKKSIAKHIENKDFVKVYIVDKEDLIITHFEGIIFEQSNKFIFMNDTNDFNFDGFIVLRKTDISEIKCTDNERFFKEIIDNEKITDLIFQRRRNLEFKLDNFQGMCNCLKNLNLPIIVECKYGNDKRFLIGPINDVEDKKVRIKYFNSRGEFDIKPVSAKYKEITFLRIDSPYANMFYKYTKEPE